MSARIAAEILDEVVSNVSDKDWKEVKDIEETLRRIFRAVGRDCMDSDESTDEEDIIAEFVAHRKCNVRCRVRYIPVDKNNGNESEDESESNKNESEDENKNNGVDNKNINNEKEIIFKKEPENMEEMRDSLRFISAHPEDFDLKVVRDLKVIFLGWTSSENDVTREEFQMYREFYEARNAIRGSSDTEDDSADDDSDMDTDNDKMDKAEDE